MFSGGLIGLEMRLYGLVGFFVLNFCIAMWQPLIGQQGCFYRPFVFLTAMFIFSFQLKTMLLWVRICRFSILEMC